MKLSFFFYVLVSKRHYRDWIPLLVVLISSLIAIVSVFIAQITIQSSVGNQSLQSLGSRLSMQVRRPFTESETTIFRNETTPSIIGECAEFFSMFSSPSKPLRSPRLTEVRAVSGGFPFFGAFTRRDGSQFEATKLASILEPNGVLLPEELRLAYDLNDGDTIKIGDEEFIVKDFYKTMSLRGSRNVSLALTVWILKSDRVRTRLLGPESLVTYQFHARENQGSDSSKFTKLISSPDVRFQTPEEHAKSITSSLSYLEDFLALIGLGSFFICLFAAKLLLFGVDARFKEIKERLNELGWSDPSLTLLRTLELLVVVVLATGCAGILSLSTGTFLAQLLGKWLNFSAHFSWTPKLLSYLALLSLSIFTMLSLEPPLTRMLANRGPKVLTILRPLVSLITIFLMSLAITRSLRLALGSALIASLVGVLSSVTYYTLSVVFNRLAKRSSSVQVALAAWLRSPKYSKLVFTTFFTLGILLLTPFLVEQSILNELDPNSNSARPSLFLFDLQSDQLETLRTIAKKFDALPKDTTPLIRAKLLSINKKPVSDTRSSGVLDLFKSREIREAELAKNRTYNITYKGGLNSNEKRVSGRPLKARLNEMAPYELSLERRFANTLGVTLQDRLEFEILGIQIETIVQEIRQVKWTEFKPGFFVALYPEEFLKLAPQSYISTIYNLSESQQIDLQIEAGNLLPNVSILQVESLFDRARSILDTITAAFHFLGILCFLSGLFALLFTLAMEARALIPQFAILRVSGVSVRKLRTWTYQFMIQGFLGPLSLAYVGAFLVTAVLAEIFFETKLTIPHEVLANSLLGLIAASVLIAEISYLWLMKKSKHLSTLTSLDP